MVEGEWFFHQVAGCGDKSILQGWVRYQGPPLHSPTRGIPYALCTAAGAGEVGYLLRTAPWFLGVQESRTIELRWGAWVLGEEKAGHAWGCGQLFGYGVDDCIHWNSQEYIPSNCAPKEGGYTHMTRGWGLGWSAGPHLLLEPNTHKQWGTRKCEDGQCLRSLLHCWCCSLDVCKDHAMLLEIWMSVRIILYCGYWVWCL